MKNVFSFWWGRAMPFIILPSGLIVSPYIFTSYSDNVFFIDIINNNVFWIWTVQVSPVEEMKLRCLARRDMTAMSYCPSCGKNGCPAVNTWGVKSYAVFSLINFITSANQKRTFHIKWLVSRVSKLFIVFRTSCLNCKIIIIKYNNL